MQSIYGCGVDSACNGNEEYDSPGSKRGHCIRLTNLVLSCADFLELYEPQNPGTLRAYRDMFRDSLTYIY
jgi:hypothetical protein